MVQVLRWQETFEPQEEYILAKMRNGGLSPYVWSDAAGETYAEHEHPYEKVLYCIHGSIQFMLPSTEETIDLSPGDCLILPSHTPHTAKVGSEGVSCAESPRNE